MVNASPDLTIQHVSRGCLFLIVGPSGAGKDTLIDWLKAQLASRSDVLFVTRTVTRVADTASEAHDTMAESAFDEAERAGHFAVTWRAHGHSYGLPAEALHHVQSGGIAVANGSRGALDTIIEAFDHVYVVELTVDAETLAKRLAGRGRETAEQIRKRLERKPEPVETNFPYARIDNSGPIRQAGSHVLQLIQHSLAGRRSMA